MGLKLWELFHKEEIELQELKGKVLAVDTSPVLYQFLSSIRQPDGTPLMDSKENITSHLMGLSTRIPSLMGQGINLCFCFDGKPPLLKVVTQEEREYKKQQAEKKLSLAREERDVDSITKYSKQSIRLNQTIVEESKEFLKYLGLPVIQSPSEAEAQCSFICEQGDAWATVSQDADTLLYNCPRLIRDLTVSARKKLPSGAYIKNTPELIDLKKTLERLKINQDQLIALAILTGTDYNPGGVKGIGPKKALKLVQQYHDFNEIFNAAQAEFDWKQVYATFKSMPIMKNYQLKWSEPDSEKIKKLLVDKHEFSQERVDAMLEKLTKRKKQQEGLKKWF